MERKAIIRLNNLDPNPFQSLLYHCISVKAIFLSYYFRRVFLLAASSLSSRVDMERKDFMILHTPGRHPF